MAENPTGSIQPDRATEDQQRRMTGCPQSSRHRPQEDWRLPWLKTEKKAPNPDVNKIFLMIDRWWMCVELFMLLLLGGCHVILDRQCLDFPALQSWGTRSTILNTRTHIWCMRKQCFKRENYHYSLEEHRKTSLSGLVDQTLANGRAVRLETEGLDF